jgi:hypothetical protein
MENAPRMKRRIVVVCLSLAGLLVAALANPAVPQKPPTRTFDWNENHDLKKWLTDNESTLRRGDACTLTFWWMDEEHADGPSGSRHELTTFVIVPADEESTRVIHDPKSSLDIRVGARYSPGDSKSSYLLQLAIAFEGTAADVFDEVDRAQAEALRYPGWRSLTVVKPARVGHELYTFSLSCQNGSEYLNGWQRRLSRPHDKAPKQ